MFINRIVVGFLFLSWLPMIGGGVFAPLKVLAQETDETLTCPIESVPTVQFVGVDGSMRVNDQLSTYVSLSNHSSYTFSGVRIGVGVYDRSERLSYGAVLAGEYQLLPGAVVEVPVELALTALSAGEYQLRTVAIQGDETAVLGALMREATIESDKIVMSKITARSSNASIEVTIGEQIFKGQPLTVTQDVPQTISVVTKNNNALPLLESALLAVVTEGSVPLGTAVRVDKVDSVKLIPSGTRTTILPNVQMPAGTYTMYAALLTKDALQPVVTVPITIGAGGTAANGTYLKVVGLSEYPLRPGSSIVACAGFLGKTQIETRFPEALGVTFTLQKNKEVVSTETVYTAEHEAYDYVSLTPGVTMQDLTLTTELLQQRSSVSYLEGGENPLEEVMKDALIPVDSLAQQFRCTDSELCDPDRVVLPISSPEEPEEPFWFYAGVVIAAALLMYLMLRRLAPETVERPRRSGLSADELQ